MAITTFQDLKVYQNAYNAAICVIKEILPKLPASERYGLIDQMRRSSKAIAPLLAEGYAKKHLPRSFKKYLDDALGESNEMIVHLSYCKDIYADRVDVKLCEELIEKYNIIGKQLYKLSKVWHNFKRYE